MTDLASICPVCNVLIEGDVVRFSYGPPGTRTKLKARVCQFAKREGCINPQTSLKDAVATDFYGDPNPFTAE